MRSKFHAASPRSVVGHSAPAHIDLVSTTPEGTVEGATITAHLTNTDGVGSGRFTWQQMQADGAWHTLQSGTSDSLHIGGDQAGTDLRVIARFVDNAGHAERPMAVTHVADVQPAILAVSPTTDHGSTSLSDGMTAPSEPSNNVVQQTTASADPVTTPLPEAAPHDTAIGTTTPAAHMMIGVNLSGAEFGSLPGQLGVDYTYPTHGEIDYYASKNLDVIRLPFLWERLQPTENGALDNQQLAQIDDIVSYANSKGMKVVLDLHNYGSGYGADVGTAATPNAAFADLWGKLAGHYAGSQNVMFGLMNEPHNQSPTDWLGSVNAAVSSIRAAGSGQEILVPGSAWDGAWSWQSSGNASAFANGVNDPAHNFAFEVHQYLDANGSGTSDQVVSSTVGAERLAEVTQWAESTGNKLFLGEYGVASNQTSLSAMDQMLTYMQAHPDAWQGATYWAGGPWWGNYMYSIEPNHGVDQPQMAVLASHVEHHA